MRARAALLTIAVVATACSSETDASSPATTPVTPPPPTTTTLEVAPTTTTSTTTASVTTTTSLVVPPPECGVELPEFSSDEVTDVEVAVLSDGADPTRLWSLSLGDRPVVMDTLGDRVYLATFDGFVASFDLDPCGLDWLARVDDGVSGVIAGEAGVFVVSRSSLAVLDRIEGIGTSFPLTDGFHTMVSGLDVLAVSDGDSVLLYDYLTRQSSSLAVGGPVTGLAASGAGIVVSRGITVELRTWLGAPVWARDMPETVDSVGADDASVMVALTSGSVVVLDLASGEVRWEQTFETGSTLVIGPIDHGELHVLEYGSDARHHHLAIEDGESIFENESPVWQTFAEYDDDLILVVDEGEVTARSLLEQDVWTISTGADGLSRFTEVDVTDGLIVALSFSAERF